MTQGAAGTVGRLSPHPAPPRSSRCRVRAARRIGWRAAACHRGGWACRGLVASLGLHAAEALQRTAFGIGAAPAQPMRCAIGSRIRVCLATGEDRETEGQQQAAGPHHVCIEIQALPFLGVAQRSLRFTRKPFVRTVPRLEQRNPECRRAGAVQVRRFTQCGSSRASAAFPSAPIAPQRRSCASIASNGSAGRTQRPAHWS